MFLTEIKGLVTLAQSPVAWRHKTVGTENVVLSNKQKRYDKYLIWLNEMLVLDIKSLLGHGTSRNNGEQALCFVPGH